MLYVAWLSILSVLLATVWFVSWAVKQTASLIQATLREIREAETDRPKTLSALGDAIDALQVDLRTVDTELQGALSLARGNRAKITNLRREMGKEAGDDQSANGAAPVRQLPRLPGRVS